MPHVEPVADANDLPQEVSVQLQEMAGYAQQEEDRTSAPPAPPTGSTPFAPPAEENDQGNNNVPDTELAIAARRGQTATVRRLLESSAATVDELSGEDGFSALMYAAWHGHTAIVQALLQANASVDLQSRLGYTALAVAAWNCSNGHTAIVQALLQASASVDLQTNGGHTALMVAAAKNGRTATVRLLLKAGAETSLRNTEGDSAETFASERNHAAIILLLQGKSLRTWPCTKVTFGLRAREARAARNRVSPATMVETMGPPCYL